MSDKTKKDAAVRLAKAWLNPDGMHSWRMDAPEWDPITRAILTGFCQGVLEMEAENTRLREALANIEHEASEHAEGYYEDARQASAEREKETERRSMRMLTVWQKLANAAHAALNPRAEGE